MKRHTKIVILILAALASALVVLSFLGRDREPPRPGPGPTQPETTRRMAARLAAIADEWAGDTSEEAGERLFRANRPQLIAVYRRQLETATEPRGMLLASQRLAQELLWAGRTGEAIEAFHGVRAMLESSNLPPAAKAELITPVRDAIAIAYLRVAEEENCLAHHTPESCIFPLAGGGVHRERRGAQAAVETLLECLASKPGDLGYRWLLNLAYMTLGQYPQGVPPSHLIPPSTFASEREIGRFNDVAAALGVNMRGLAGGCAVDDFDGDGRLDIFASSWGLRDQLRLFIQTPEGRFIDQTEPAGLTGEVGGINLCHADYDNDGLLDVYVIRGGWLGAHGKHPSSLLRNTGHGTFRDVTEEVGLLDLYPSHSAAWADVDGDGWLDLFVAREQDKPGDHGSQLYRSEAGQRFVDHASELGLQDLGFVKGAAWGDYQNDGRPDLYVSRIGQPNLLLRNDGERFTDVTRAAGVSEPVFSFPTWFWDYDNDGWLDIFVAGFDGASIAAVAGDTLGTPHRRGHPRLYRNQGDGSFRDVTAEARLDRVLLVMGANFGDLDNDGWLDLYLGTGAPDFRALLPNRMFRNDRGRVFEDVTTSGGFGHIQKGHGIAFADIDGDGDQDIYAVMGGWFTADTFPNALFLNPGHGNHWVTLRLEGTRANRAAIGARVRVDVKTPSGPRSIHALVGTGGSFGSSSLQQEIGLGDATAIEAVEVRWPSSSSPQVLREVPMDRVVSIREEARN